METQFQYIRDLAKHFKQFSEKPALLFKAINELPKNTIEDIFKEYGDPENKFQPVNLLRAELARKLLDGIKINEDLVEEIKEKIRKKDKKYFSQLSKEFLQELEVYPIGKRDMFANWQNTWAVFHTYFYRGITKDTTRLYLEQLCKQLQKDLKVIEYDYHWVDFFGSSNFGSVRSWIALFPMHKNSHQEAYQFFINLEADPEAGMVAGSLVENDAPESRKRVDSYSEALKKLEGVKAEIIKLNNESRNYFKFAPGSQASEWSKFYNEKIAAISFSGFNLGDISKYNSLEEINTAVGLPADSRSNQTYNLWLFKTANVGDVVFANKGVNTCIGIGIIEGEYYYDDKADAYKYRRKMNWITDKVYQYKADTLKKYKTLFRPDTFSPTKVWEFLLSEYARVYPELVSVFEKHKLKYNNESPATSIVSEPREKYGEKSEGDDSKEINFWWLNANPKIWSISNHNEGQRQTYTTHNEKGNKRRIYKYFEAAKPGDLIIGYESTPTKQIKAIYEVTKGIHTTANGEEIEFELVEKLEIPVHWNDLKNNPALQNCEVFINNQGSLFRLSEDEYDVIREAIDNKNIITEKLLGSTSIKSYKFKEDTDKPFISEADFLQAVTLLRRKKNIILQGPPGVGKTFLARKIAYEIMKEERDANIEMVQFHQSYSYEDFIQGLRPTKKGFDIINGTFYLFCQKALAHPDRPFFFIIDEINRGNLSKVFGELMMLIEADKRDEKFALKLTYAEDEDDRFYVPDNLHIIGTMNTADRSLAIVDYALRRRFAFIPLVPDFGVTFRDFLSTKGVSSVMVEHISSSVSKVNARIKEDQNLGEGFQIGHSYFCTFNKGEDEGKWWNEILSFELKPLLDEIWFDDLSKVSEMTKLLSR